MPSSYSDSDSGWNKELIIAVSKKQGKTKTISEKDRIRQIESCLDRGADIDTVDECGNTTLHIADISTNEGEPALKSAENLGEPAIASIWNTPSTSRTSEFPLNSASKKSNRKRTADTEVKNFDESVIKKRLIGVPQSDRHSDAASVEQRSNQQRTANNELDEYGNKICGMTLTDVPQPGLNRKAADDKTYPVSKGSLKDSQHGNVYQLMHLMLILHRARTMGYSFRLATEMDAAEKFDDVVLRYTDSDGHEAYRFVQAKHKQDETKPISASDLLDVKDGAFGLLKYFTSWQKIKKHPDFAGSGSKHFILCTNIDLAIESLKKENIHVSEVKEPDEFLEVTNRTRQPLRYKLVVENPSGLWDVLKSASDLHRLASKLAGCVVHDENIHLNSKIIKNYHLALAKEVVNVDLKRFSDNFLLNNGLSSKAAEFRKLLFLYTRRLLSKKNQSEQYVWNLLGQRSLKLSSNFGVKPRSAIEPDQTQCTELPADQVDDTKITHFLDEFILAVNQPNEVELGEIMKREISAHGRFDLPDAEFVWDAFQSHMLNWFKAKQGEFLEKKDADDFFSEMKDKVFSIKIQASSAEYPDELKKLEIHFNCENTELQNFMKQPDDGSNHRVLEIICPDHTLLTALQVRQTLAQQQNCARTEGFIFIRLERLSTPEKISLLLGAFKSRQNHNLLVVDCESGSAKQHLETLWNRLCDVMSKNVRKRMVVITQRGKDLGTQFKLYRRKYDVKNDDRSFDKLMKDSQKKILNKKVFFQGQNHETSFGELLGIRDYDNLREDELKDLSEVMHSDTLMKFISQDAIQIGRDLEGSNEMVAHYVDRTICRHVVIKDDILKENHIPDVLAISGIVREFSDGSVSLGETASMIQSRITDSLTVSGITKDRPGESMEIGETSTTAQSPSNFTILDSGREEEQFNDLCAKNETRNIHWLKKDAGKYIWEQSRGDITYLVQYKEASESDDHTDRTGATDLSEDQLTAYDDPVIISGTAGMGKSIMLTHFAQKLKKKEPGMMVLKIDLNQGASALENVKNKSSHNLDSIDGAVTFLVKKLLNRETKLTQKVFVNIIRKKRKLALIFDGFDEISPTYEETVIKLLHTLCKHGIKKLIITTRPHTKAVLEMKLNAFSHELQPFSPHVQQKFLTEFWTARFKNSQHDSEQNTKKRIQKYAKAIMEKLGESIKDQENKFTGNPLQARMVAEIFENRLEGGRESFHSCKEFMDSKVDWPKFPEKIDLIYLYEHFVEKKFECCYKKSGDDSAKVAHIKNRERRYKTFLNEHKRLALNTLFDKDKVSELLLSQGDAGHRLPQSIDSDINPEQDGIIVTQCIDGRPHFGHRTYAEYFAAKFFSEMLEHQEENESLQQIFVADVLLGENYETMRNFMNWLLSDKDDTALSYKSWKSYLNGHRSQLNETIFHVAAAEGHVHIIRLFLNCLGTNPRDRKAFIHLEDSSGRTAVHRALEYRRMEGIKLLIENTEFDVNCINQCGKTPLYVATKKCQLVVVEYLHDKGADVNSRNNDNSTPLLIAAYQGKLDVVDYLLKNGATVNSPDKNGFTPLYIAAQEGKLNVVNCLLKNKADVNFQNNDGFTPLYIAAQKGKLDVVKCLLKKGANVDSRNNDGSTALLTAAYQGKLAVVNCLLKNGATVNSPNKNGFTPLYIAAQEGKLNVVNCLLENKANVNFQNNDGFTPLYIAAQKGKLDVVNCLLKNGANVNTQNNDGSTALLTAAYQGELDVVNCLLKNGATVDSPNKHGFTPLYIAAQEGKVEIVNCLLKNRANVNFQNNDGFTPLYIAAYQGKLDVVNCLLKKGADVNSQNKNGSTLLYIAAQKGKLHVVDCLLKKGADVNSQNKNGSTPLYIAAQESKLDVVDCLIGNGANVDSKCNDGSTPLYIAAQKGKLDVVNCFIKKRANVDSKCNDGSTPLYIAAHVGELDVVNCLLENGANVDSGCNDGSTPLYIAAQKGKLDVVNCLIKKRANVDSKCNDGSTPLYIAAHVGELDVVNCLLENGANVDSECNDGSTPLYIAAQKGKLDVVNCLIKERANVDSKCNDGSTPLYIAAHVGELDVVNCLLKYGANVDSKCNDGSTSLYIAAQESDLDVVNCLLEYGANVDSKCNDGSTPLYIAAQESDLDVVYCLLENKANVNFRNNDGFTPLYIAAQKGKLDVVNCLLKRGANVNFQNNDGSTSLLTAAHQGKLDVVTCLLKNGATVDSPNKNGFTPLYIAAQEGKLDVVDCLLENGANVDSKCNDGSTLLYIAAQESDLDVVNCLLKNGANVDSKCNDGLTPLYIAAQEGKLDVVDCLLENGANVDSKCNDGSTPLYIAAQKGKLDVVNCLIKNRANVGSKCNDGLTPLYIAAQEGQLDVVDCLLENGANVDFKCNDGSTPLYIAAQKGKLDVVNYLLEKEANVDSKCNDGSTPLYIAAQESDLDVVNCLLENGANVDSKCHDGSTPLYIAAQEGKLDVVDCLLENGANVDSEKKNGSTPLYIAAQEGQLDVVDCLLENRANVDSKCNDGSTPLYIAAQKGKLDVVNCLIKNRANVGSKCNDGLTPLYIAAQEGQLDVVDCLLENGANVDSKCNDGSTPLYIAAQKGKLDVVNCLIKNRANVGSKCNDGLTPLYIAAQEGQLDVVDCLIENGANVNSECNDGSTSLYVHSCLKR